MGAKNSRVRHLILFCRLATTKASYIVKIHISSAPSCQCHVQCYGVLDMIYKFIPTSDTYQMSVTKNNISFKESQESQIDGIDVWQRIAFGPSSWALLSHRSPILPPSFCVAFVGLRAQKSFDSTVTSDCNRLARVRKVDSRAHSFPERSDLQK